MNTANGMHEGAYQFQPELVQAIVAQLNGQPAGAVRGLLNAIEQACVEQDRARATQAAEALRAEGRAAAKAGIAVGAADQPRQAPE